MCLRFRHSAVAVGIDGAGRLPGLVVCLFAAALIGGIVALLLATRVAPMLRRWRYTCWIGDFAADAHRVLVGAVRGADFCHLGSSSRPDHRNRWLVSRAEGLPLSVSDCAVLFIVMVGVVLVPISVGGWGLREFAMVSLLGAHGIAADQALLPRCVSALVFMISALRAWPSICSIRLPAKANAAGARAIFPVTQESASSRRRRERATGSCYRRKRLYRLGAGQGAAEGRLRGPRARR